MRFLLIVLATVTSTFVMAQPELEEACFGSDAVADPTGTVAACDLLINASPEDQDVLLFALHHRGLAKRQAGDMQGSIADFEAVLRINPDDTATLRMLAWTYREQGKAEKAEALYSDILEIEDHWQAWLSRCAVRTDLERYLLALEDCAEVEARVYQDADADNERRESIMQDTRYFSALSLNQLDRPTEAASVARQGLELPDINGHLYFMTLVGLWNSNQLQDINHLLFLGLQKYPNDPDLVYFLDEWKKR